MLADPARDDAGVVAEVRRDVERDAVPTHPAGHTNADGGDLGLGSRGRTGDPDADASLPPFATHAEAGEGSDQPFLQPVHEAPHVAGGHRAMRAGEVQHHIGHALAGAVVGPLAAAAGGEGGEAAGIGQLLGPGGGAGGVERGCSTSQTSSRGRAGADGGDTLLHEGHCVGVRGEAVGGEPFGGGGNN